MFRGDLETGFVVGDTGGQYSEFQKIIMNELLNCWYDYYLNFLRDVVIMLDEFYSILFYVVCYSLLFYLLKGFLFFLVMRLGIFRDIFWVLYWSDLKSFVRNAFILKLKEI